jgi:hypothetical protein
VTTPVSALQGALAAEHAACYGYTVSGAYLSGSRQAAAEQDWTGHDQARDALAGMIARLGATPVAAQAFYDLPFRVHDAGTAMALAAYLEDGVTGGYLGIVSVDDQRLRSFGALAMQGSADRAAYWRGRTQAFPGLASRLASVGSARVVAGEDPGDRGGGLINVVGDGDPLGPGPPEPPDAVRAAAGVDVLLQRPRSRVDHVQAGPTPRRRHQPSLQPPMRQLIGQLLQINSLLVGPFGFHRNHHCNV